MLQPAEHLPEQYNSPPEAVSEDLSIVAEPDESDRERAHNEKLRAISQEDQAPRWTDYNPLSADTPRSLYRKHSPYTDFTDSGRRQEKRAVDAEPTQLVRLRRITGLILGHTASAAPLARHLYEEHRELVAGQQPVTTGQLRELSEKIEWLMPQPNSARPITPAQQALLVWTVHGAIVGGRQQVPKPLANLLDEHPQLDRAAAGRAIRHALARLSTPNPEEERRILGSDD